MYKSILTLLLCLSLELFGASSSSTVTSGRASSFFYSNDNHNIPGSEPQTSPPRSLIIGRNELVSKTTASNCTIYNIRYGKPVTGSDLQISFNSIEGLLFGYTDLIGESASGTGAAVIETTTGGSPGPLLVQAGDLSGNTIRTLGGLRKASSGGTELSSVKIVKGRLFACYKDSADDNLYGTNTTSITGEFSSPTLISTGPITSLDMDIDPNGNLLLVYSVNNTGIVKIIDTSAADFSCSDYGVIPSVMDFARISATKYPGTVVVAYRSPDNTPYAATLYNGALVKQLPLGAVGSATSAISSSCNIAGLGAVAFYRAPAETYATQFEAGQGGWLNAWNATIVSDIQPSTGVTMIVDRVGNKIVNFLHPSTFHPIVFFQGRDNNNWGLLATAPYVGSTTQAPYIFALDASNRSLGNLLVVGEDPTRIDRYIVTSYNKDWKLKENDKVLNPVHTSSY